MPASTHSNAIKVGFVGLSSSGWASTALAPGLLHPRLASSFDLVAVSTTSAASAEASAKKYSDLVGHPVKAYHGDVSSIANDPDVDLVVIAIKSIDHKPAVLRAIEAGKDVFVEWPAGVGLEDASEIAEAAKAKGVRVMVGAQGKHAPVVKKLKEILASGKIGKVYASSIIAVASRELGYWGPRINARNTHTADLASGATLLHIAVGHQMSVFTDLFGEFATVSATTSTQFPTATLVDDAGKPTDKKIVVTAPDQVMFSGLLKSGMAASFSWRGGLPCTKGRKQFVWVIDGEDGAIRVEGDEISSSFLHIQDSDLYLNGEPVEVDKARGPADILAGAWAAFAQGEGYTTIDDAVRNHRLLDAIMRSAEEGRTVRV